MKYQLKILLATTLLLFTACDSEIETDAMDKQNLTAQVDTNVGTGDSNGTSTNNTSNGVGNDDSTTTPTAILNFLKLTIDKTSLNKDESTTVKVMAEYSDGSSKEVTNNVEWVVTPSDAVKVTNTTLMVLQDKATTVKSKLKSVISDAINLNITWIVNGHTLPPEPNKTLNDSTLLGIDVNDNGVRDDVERWIYEEYKDKHPIHIDIAMQAGRAYKKVLETPERAKEIRKEVNGALFCGWYYENDAEEFGDPVLVHERIDTSVKSKYFNTKARNDVYWQYDTLLSGGSYALPKPWERKALCDFNTTQYK